jgi:hypothetical protein
VSKDVFSGHYVYIKSLYIDYDQNCRITFTLIDDTLVRQPMIDDPNTTEAELRYWDVILALYQASIFSVLSCTHFWAHFHLNSCVNHYLVENNHHKAHSKSDDHLLARVLKTHVFYTTPINIAGLSDLIYDPNMSQYSTCEYICYPWKVTPLLPMLFVI